MGQNDTTGNSQGEGCTEVLTLSYTFSKSIKLFQNHFFKKYFKDIIRFAQYKPVKSINSFLYYTAW